MSPTITAKSCKHLDENIKESFLRFFHGDWRTFEVTENVDPFGQSVDTTKRSSMSYLELILYRHSRSMSLAVEMDLIQQIALSTVVRNKR